jgi:uncharacterized protein with ATP-grasp and redox domains
MRIYLDCIGCFVRQALDACRLATDDERIHEAVIRKVLKLASELDMSQSPPEIGQKIHRLIRNLVGSDDPYRELKKRSNNLALKMYPELRKQIIGSKMGLETALRLAIAGNILDFGVNSSVTESDLRKAISESLTMYFDMGQIESFKDSVKQAKEILYLADNAGEIVFDRLLIEQLPWEKITLVVRGNPVINDATRRDAVISGLAQIVEVIDNGSDGPGTILENCSSAFRDRFANAELIIAKGQGNYETLSDVDKNIFFLLQAKCPVIADHLGCEVGAMVVRKNVTCRSTSVNE